MRTPTPQLLRLPRVIDLTGLGRDSIYRLIREGKFPAQRRISDRASAWREDEIRKWIDSRPVLRISTLQGKNKPPAAA